jgi:hypothetical protein
VLFTEHHDNPPYIQLRAHIALESHAGRAVIVSTREPDGRFHIWLATEWTMFDAHAISKDGNTPNGATTREILLFQDRLMRWPHGHYLTYTLPNGNA